MPQPKPNDKPDPYLNDLTSEFVDEGEDGTLDSVLAALEEVGEEGKVSKHLPGQHDQRTHNPHEGREGSVSIAEDRPETSIPLKLKDFEGVKTHLGQGTKLIVSAERSELRPEENQVRSIGLKRILNNYSQDAVMQEGQWGGAKERSYVATIPDKSVEELQQLAFTELKQQAVVVIQGGKAELRYADGKKEYAEVSDLSDVSGEKDNYSKLGEVKYRLNFKERKNG